MNHSRTITGLLLAGSGLVLLSFFFTFKWGIWLPDVVTQRTVTLDELATATGDHFSLIQRWAGDGYVTRFVHTNKQKRAWWLTIDGDAMKAWSGKIWKIDDDTIGILVLKESFAYKVQSHLVTDREKTPRFVLEIPEDGSPAFLMEKVTSGAERQETHR